MEGIIELAIAVGRLENRISKMENTVADLAKRVSELEKEPEGRPMLSVSLEPPADDKMTPDKLLQQGIDSIMGYQWPPAKGGNEA